MEARDTAPEVDEPRTFQTPLVPDRTGHVLVSLAGATAIALLAYLCAGFGLIAVAPFWITPVFIGVVVALASGVSWNLAILGSAAGLSIGVAALPAWFLQLPGGGLDSLAAAVFVLLGCVAAGTTAYLLGTSRQSKRAEWAASVVLVLFIIGSMWTTAVMVDRGAFAGGNRTLNQLLMTRPDFGSTVTDFDYNLQLFYDLQDAKPYYDAFVEIWLADPVNRGGMPVGVTAYRPPTLYYLWSFLPPRGDAIPWAFLPFATLAVASGFSIAAQLSRPRVAVLGALILSVAYLFIATTPFVTFVDGWGMALTLAATALFIASVRRDSRWLLWLAIAVFVFGAAVRELLIYPTLLAAASALVLPAGRRWYALWPWLVGLTVFVAAYSAHIVFIGGRVGPGSGYRVWLQGGVDHLLATLRFFELFFGVGSWLLPFLTIVGLVGAMGIWNGQPRLSAFLTSMIAVPLAAFLVVGNGGIDLMSRQTLGYWGLVVVPTALAMVPVGVSRVLGSTPQGVSEWSAASLQEVGGSE